MPALTLTPLKLAVALLALAGGAVQAQSLNELYQAARAYDANYLSARATAESVQYRLTQAEALRKPTLGLGASATHNQVDPPAVFQTINGQRVQVAGDRVGASTLQAGLRASMSLYNRANGFTINQAERGVLKASTALEAAEQDLMVRVAQAYFDVLASRESLNLAQANKRAIGEQLASAKRNFEVGTATITDTREAQSRFDLSTATEIAAENDLRVKSVILDQLVGRGNVDPKPLAVPIALPALEPLNVDPWLSQAEESPSVRLARIDLESAQLEVEKAKAANAPTVDMTASLGGQDQSGRGASPKGFTSSGSVGVQVNLPLYTGGYNEARKQETLKLQERSRNDLEAARRTAAERTRSAFLQRQSLQAQVKALESAEASAKLALEATQLGYKVGVRVNLDVLNAQAQLNSTQNSLTKARFDTLLTGLRLRQVTGQLRPEDIAALDALLAK